MKIAIAGAGTIVPGFLDAASKVGDIEFVSIFARETSYNTMVELQKAFNIGNIYHEYDQLLKDDIDAVYVALPNHLHFEYAKRALEAKKHVFLEKPFVSNAEEAAELVLLANQMECLVFEAIMNQYLPSFQQLKQELSKVGDVKIVQLNYSQYSRRYDQFKEGTIHAVFDPSKSGGALMDINVYNIHFIVGLFGQPQKVYYSANIEKGIDTSGVLMLDYGSFKCIAIGAKDSFSNSFFSIQGDQGTLFSHQAASRFHCFHFEDRNKVIKDYENENPTNPMIYEIKAFKALVQRSNSEQIKMTNQHSLSVMKVLDEARLQIGLLKEDVC